MSSVSDVENSDGHAGTRVDAIVTPRLSLFVERDGRDLEWHSLNFEVGPEDKPVTILDNVFGRIPKGEVAALMGPSGAGKSSLLNVLAGRVKPSKSLRISGRITIDGEEIDPVANRQNIAYVMQDDSCTLILGSGEATYSPRPTNAC